MFYCIPQIKVASNMVCAFQCNQLEDQCNAFQYALETLICSAAKVEINKMYDYYICLVKGTVSVISSDSPCKHGNAFVCLNDSFAFVVSLRISCL